ncbi:hypothetical protein EYF80_058142 [Liparis tanakae]|uniref:HTH hxlR-type domain-containing protein n=1 Tax=Liparis tanakae TaxID=230148 RepID=A0A4Z2ESU0_9TELE|nr:hypothetical protein EYF80_058142 [Liparis tanakae]
MDRSSTTWGLGSVCPLFFVKNPERCSDTTGVCHGISALDVATQLRSLKKHQCVNRTWYRRVNRTLYWRLNRRGKQMINQRLNQCVLGMSLATDPIVIQLMADGAEGHAQNLQVRLAP